MSSELFKTQPFEHQLTSFNLAKDATYWGHLHEMGAGKTKIAIDEALYLHSQNKITAVLLVAPNGVHSNWAEKEIEKHADYQEIYHWAGKPTSQKAKRELEYFQQGREIKGNLAWFCINIEAIRTNDGLAACERFLTERNCMMVVDESTIIKNPKAKQTKAAMYLGQFAKYRRILTGTPITQGPLDFYSQCKFLDKDSISFTSFAAFRSTFAQEKTVVLNSGKRFNQVVGYTRLGYLKELIQPFTDRILKKDCLDLPEKLYQTVEVQMTDHQKNLYNTMRELYIARLGAEEAQTGLVSVQNVLSLMMKLQQIVTGFIIDDENVTHSVPSNRIEQLLSIVEGFTGKALIWCAFRKNIEDVVRALRKAYGDESTVAYYGDTSMSDRSRALELMQHNPLTRFFVSNKTGAEGITVTSAEYSIYFSNTYNLHTRLQSEDRNHRIGQTRNVLYTDFLCKGTVDEQILKSLLNKRNLANEVLSDWRKFL